MSAKIRYSDQEIVAMIRKGDQKALVFLFEENYSPVRNLILKNNGKQDDIDDILQEAVIVVWQNVSKADFELSAKLNTYLYAIAKNIWMKHLNKNQRQEPIHDGHYNLHHTNNDEAFAMDSKIVVQYMNKIGNTCRELLHLFYFDGLDMAQIGERLGFNNPNTTKAKKYQCLKKLEELIRQDFVKSDFR